MIYSGQIMPKNIGIYISFFLNSPGPISIINRLEVFEASHLKFNNFKE